MHLTKLFCAALLVAGMIAALPGTGSAGSITVDDATGRNNYLGSLNTMVSGLTSLSQFYLDRQGTPTTGIELIYNPGEDVDGGQRDIQCARTILQPTASSATDQWHSHASRSTFASRASPVRAKLLVGPRQSQ